MKVICICVGSSCHIKGSYQVVKTYERLISELGLSDRVKLKASFCQGKCTGGIAVTFEGTPIEGVTVSEAEHIFRERILPAL